jgi:hypothetical protein
VSNTKSADLMCGIDVDELHLPGIVCWLLVVVEDVKKRGPDPQVVCLQLCLETPSDSL